MTDLEDLWDDLPVGSPPTRDILRAGRRASGSGGSGRRRRPWLRPLLTAGVVTGLVGAFLVGTRVGDGGSGGLDAAPESVPPLPSRAAFQADLQPADSCDDLLATYVRRGLERVTAWGWDDGYGYPYAVDAVRDLSEVAGKSATYDQRAAAPTTVRQENSDTGTNVQEIGVDEPDLVKTDGSLLVRLRDDELIVYDVTGPTTERLASLDLAGLEDGEIMLTDDTVVAVGSDEESPRETTSYGPRAHTGTRVLTVDLADPTAPKVVDDVAYDARLESARQHGSTIRLVLASGLPDLGFVEPGKHRDRRTALARNRAKVKNSTIADWLPTLTADGGDPEQLLDCTDVAVPSDELALDTTSVVGFDAATPADVDAIGLAGSTDIAYESVDHLYLAASPASAFPLCFDCWGVRVAPGVTGGETYLFDFALDGPRATHVASGEVEGAVPDRWAMDEADGVLRVAVGPTSETGNFNSVLTLRRTGQDLVEVGRLDGLGRNEDIKSVRWSDGLAILVTFRQVDPLYAVDLTDVRDPRLLGKLKIPGFSSYLHPLGPNRLVGIGEGPGDGGWGAQAGLFDVSDLSEVRQIDVHHFRRSTEALAGDDPRSFTFLQDSRTVLTVVSDYRGGSRTGYVAELRVEDGTLVPRLVQVEYGDDVDQVRTIPLPDGRVVLVTGEDVEFFPLGGE